MENSYHTTKAAYHCHTQHFGRKVKKSSFVQIYQHYYKIIAHQFKNKETQIYNFFSIKFTK